MAKALKVLFAGDVGGRVEALFKRMETVNASSGPFDLLLCTGGFFGGSGEWRTPLIGPDAARSRATAAADAAPCTAAALPPPPPPACLLDERHHLHSLQGPTMTPTLAS